MTDPTLKDELETVAIGYVTVHAVLFNLQPNQKIRIEVNFPDYDGIYNGTVENAFYSPKVKKMFDYPIDTIRFYYNEKDPTDKKNGTIIIESNSTYGTLEETQVYHENAVKELAEYLEREKEESK